MWTKKPTLYHGKEKTYKKGQKRTQNEYCVNPLQAYNFRYFLILVIGQVRMILCYCNVFIIFADVNALLLNILILLNLVGLWL